PHAPQIDAELASELAGSRRGQRIFIGVTAIAVAVAVELVDRRLLGARDRHPREHVLDVAHGGGRRCIVLIGLQLLRGGRRGFGDATGGRGGHPCRGCGPRRRFLLRPLGRSFWFRG